MTMTPKTLQDIVDETRAFHQRLISHLSLCKLYCPTEREKMLLNFIVEQSNLLSSSLTGLENIQDKESFRTWLYEYSDGYTILQTQPENIAFNTMEYGEICETIRQINNQIIDLYEEINQRSHSPKPEMATAVLLEYMQANTKQMAEQTANVEGL